MKKSYFIRTFATLILVGVSIFAINSCKKNVGSTDLLADPVILPKSTIQVNVLDAASATKDSISGFSVSITATVTNPDGTKNSYAVVANAPADRKYILNLTGSSYVGDYTVVVSKDGYVTETRTFSVSSLIKTSNLNIPSTVQMTKSAIPVTLNPSKGGVIAIAPTLGSTAPPVAKVTMPSGTVITKADGSIETATISIAATNMAPANFTSPTGDVTLSAAPPTTGSIPTKTLNFQPEGLQFSKPLIVGMYIGDVIAGLTTAQSQKIIQNIKLANNSSGKPAEYDHFANDTAYFKIYHFSEYDLDLGYKLHKIGEYDKPVSVPAVQCNVPFVANILNIFQEPNADLFCRLLGLYAHEYKETVKQSVSKDPIPGSRWSITATSHAVKYQILNPDGSVADTHVYEVAGGPIAIGFDFITCHNQGGN